MIRICMVGTGYVGLVSGACMADFGNTVTCVDINRERIEKLERGEIPFYEPGLDRLVLKNVREGRLQFSTSLADGMRDADVVFIAVQTPMSESGEADLQYVMKVGEQIGDLLDDYKVVVTKSTVPVGTSRALRKVIAARPEARGELRHGQQSGVPARRVEHRGLHAPGPRGHRRRLGRAPRNCCARSTGPCTCSTRRW